MNGQVGITVAEVLSLMPSMQVLAGAGGLGRLVRSVGVMESGDLYPLIRQGDLILTGLYALRDDPGAREVLIPELQRRGAAALAIKLRYVGSSLDAMRAQADRLGFPLLALPAEAAYADVMQPVYGQILSEQSSRLARQQQVNQAVIQAMLEGGGLPRLAAALADLLRNPVAIRDMGGQVLAVAEGPGAGGLDLAQLSRQAAPTGDYRISGRDTLHRTEVVQAGGRRLTRTVTAVAAGAHRYGEILVWELHDRLCESDMAAVDTVSGLVALAMAHQRALLEVERRYRSEFLAALFRAGAEAEAGLVQRARTFGWELGRPCCVAAFRVATDLGEACEQFVAALGRAAPDALVGQADQHVVALLPADSGADPMQQVQALLALAEPFRKRMRVTAGVGRVYSGLAGLRTSFEEAKRAASVGERVWGEGGAYHYDSLGVYQLLAMLAPGPEVERFLAAIDKLLAYEQESRIELVRTLEAYFACKGNIRKVSEKLFAHYNTVLYRMERIQQITGVNLEDPTGRLHLQVALQAARLFGRLPPEPGSDRHVLGVADRRAEGP